jgi:hypothetical protein
VDTLDSARELTNVKRNLTISNAVRTPSNTRFPRRGLRPLAPAGGEMGLDEGRWTPLRRPAVGSRGVGKRKTLAEMGANDELMCGQRQPPRGGGLRARSRYQEDGAVERISLVESAHIRQHAFTASALRALPPQVGLSVSSERRWTALRRASPGSRAVGKHCTLSDTQAASGGPERTRMHRADYRATERWLTKFGSRPV